LKSYSDKSFHINKLNFIQKEIGGSYPSTQQKIATCLLSLENMGSVFGGHRKHWASIRASATPRKLFHQAIMPKCPNHNPTTTSALDRLIFPAYAASKGSDHHHQEAEDVSGMSDRRRVVHRPYV
jgi:hypothetical protein